MSHAGKEATFLRQCAAIRDNTESVHLQAVIVVEAQRFMLNDMLIQLEPTLLQTLAAARVAGVQDRHVVLLRHLIDCCEQRCKVFLRIDILLTVSRQQDILAFSKPRRA